MGDALRQMVTYRAEIIREVATTVEVAATNSQVAALEAARMPLPPVDSWEVREGFDVHVYDGGGEELRHERYHDTDVYGHCDTCGAPCDHKGCTANRAHAAAISDSVFSRTVLILSYAPQGEDGGAAGFFWEPPESLAAVTSELERVIGEGGYQVSLFTAKVPADLTPEQTTYWIELNMKELLL